MLAIAACEPKGPRGRVSDASALWRPRHPAGPLGAPSRARSEPPADLGAVRAVAGRRLLVEPLARKYDAAHQVVGAEVTEGASREKRPASTRLSADQFGPPAS